MDPGSNLGRRLRIGRPGSIGRAGAPATYSAAVRGVDSPEFTVNGAPGVKSTRAWVWDGLRITRDPPGAKAGLGSALGGARHGGGGSVRRSSPAHTCSGCARFFSGRKRARVRVQG